MMKKYVLLFLLLSIIVSSCKKSTDIIDPETPCLPYSVPECKIREIVTYVNGKYAKLELFYDSVGRLIYQRDSSDFIRELFLEYTDGKVEYLTKDSVIIETLFLDAHGYATSNIGTLTTPSYHWKYDLSGFMVEQSTSVPILGTTTHQYGYQCFNRVSVSETWSGNGLPSCSDPELIYSMAYYPDQRNTIGNENHGIYFYGKQDNCLVKWIIDHQQDAIDTVRVYFYEVDSLFRVKTETVKKAGEILRVRTFTYAED